MQKILCIVILLLTGCIPTYQPVSRLVERQSYGYYPSYGYNKVV